MKYRPENEMPFLWERAGSAPDDITGPVMLAVRMLCDCVPPGTVGYVSAQRIGKQWIVVYTGHEIEPLAFFRLPLCTPSKTWCN